LFSAAATILYCGDVGVETGFGRVAQQLIPALAEHHEVHALCVNWHGDPSPMQEHCRMYPAMAHGSDPFGSHRIGELVQIVKPDVVFIVNDIWVAISLVDGSSHSRKALASRLAFTLLLTPTVYPRASSCHQQVGPFDYIH
jgi:hypothetical protein